MSSHTIKRGKVTPEHQAEAARLMRIWNANKARLAALGFASQEAFGLQFEIGNQSAVSAFLNGRVAISLKAAASFARGLECKVGDFSARLAKLLNEAGADAPPARVAPSSTGAIESLFEAVKLLIKSLATVPRARRADVARELAVLAHAPNDPDTLRIIMGLLEPFVARPDVTGRSAAPATAEERAIAMIKSTLPALDPELAADVLAKLNAILLAALHEPNKVRRLTRPGQASPGERPRKSAAKAKPLPHR